MLQSWRWFGPGDAVTLAAARQAGATGIVTSLHHIPYGEIWSRTEIAKRIHEVSGTGLGLPLTKALVEANRASLALMSEPSKGTLAEITFPTPRVLAD